jgi:hypothetical protein
VFKEERIVMKNVTLVAACGLLAAAGWASGQPPTPVSPAQATLDDAAKQNKYTFVLFHKQDDAATRAMRQTVATALGKPSLKAEFVSVSAADPNEKPLIDRWGLGRSPMPLVLAVAPNGAVTGGFPLKLTEQDIAGAFVSPGMADCLKATQARKLVLLCVRPAGAELPAGVNEFKADAQYGPVTEVVTVRADDAGEAGFLKTLGVKPSPATVTALLAPPGSLLGTFDGPVTKAQLVEKVKAGNACCPGGKCRPNGCPPPAKAEPKR